MLFSFSAFILSLVLASCLVRVFLFLSLKMFRLLGSVPYQIHPIPLSVLLYCYGNIPLPPLYSYFPRIKTLTLLTKYKAKDSFKKLFSLWSIYSSTQISLTLSGLFKLLLTRSVRHGVSSDVPACGSRKGPSLSRVPLLKLVFLVTIIWTHLSLANVNHNPDL